MSFAKRRIVIFRSNPIDPDSRVEKEANSLYRLGNDVTLFGWDRNENYCIKKTKKKLPECEVDRYCVGAKAGFGEGKKNLFSFLKFQAILFFWVMLKGQQYDVFHFCDFDTGFSGSIACRLLRKPFVFDVFDYLSTDANSMPKRIIRTMEDSVINRANATIICTEKRRQQIGHTKPKLLTVVHNSPPECELSEMKSSAGRVKIAYVGILQDHRLIKELLQVVKENPCIELHIGGFGKLEDIVRSYEADCENIFFYGKLPYEMTLELEKRCDILTALYDPHVGNHRYAAPNKFYEGLMLGKPLIMVKDTGMSEYIDDYNIGELIDYSKDGLIAGIQALCRRRDEWKEISVRMKKLYQKQFSWAEMENRLKKLYEQI